LRNRRKFISLGTFQNEQDFSDFNYTIYDTPTIVDAFFIDTLKSFRAAVETWDGYQEFLPKLDHLIEHVAQIGQKCYVPNKRGEGFNVLNHGDFHLRNVLLKNNTESRVESLRFVCQSFDLYSCD
jgi:aminoglycoside phosphotransferase (APT) family kinase protein